MNTALLHFLWQGALIACLLSIALVFAQSARARYAWACAALLAMPVAFVITFALSLPQEPHPLRIPIFFTPPPAISAATDPLVAPRPFDPTSLWMAGVALLYGYRFIGWMAAQRLRRRGVCAAPAEWQERMTKLSGRIRMTQPVQLLESALAQTPMTIGLWRPVILMPLGLLAGLPSAQVEAILLHELAHIRRHDYLVNLLQAFVEGLLFYHPAVWWVSHVIRREREMCCDDLAVAATGDALTYTRALAALEQRRVQVPILAASGGSLMLRVQRLLGEPGKFSPAPALVFLTLATGAALFAFAPAPAPVPVPAPQPAPQPAPRPSPAPSPAPSPQAPAPARSATPNADRAATAYERWLNEEAAWIISPDERAAFERLQTDDERQMFIEQFWLRRDPTPDTRVNEMKEEHYRRIAWSNDRYSFPGVPGWSSDRGMTYIKFGPPQEEVKHPDETPRRETWKYPLIQGVGAVDFDFVDTTGDGRYQLAVPRVARVPGDGPAFVKQFEKVAFTYGFPEPVVPTMFDRLQRFVNQQQPRVQ